MKIGIYGAGCVGQFVGAHLHAANLDVLFVGRRMLRRTKKSGQLTCTDYARPSWTIRIAAEDLRTSENAADLASCDVVFVCVKCKDTTDVATFLSSTTVKTVVSLQNGVDNVRRLRQACPKKSVTVVTGMIPYGVNEISPGHVHRGTAGNIVFDNAVPKPLVRALRNAGLGVNVVNLAKAKRAQQYKLVVNLGNALNAAAGKPLAACLRDRNYRLLLQAVWREGIAAVEASGVSCDEAAIGGRPLKTVARILGWPDAVYRCIAAIARTTDETYRSSMLVDLERNNGQTEIDELNGVVVKLGSDLGVDTPVNRYLKRVINKATKDANGSPQLKPADIISELDRSAPSWRRTGGGGAITHAALLTAVVVIAAGFCLFQAM